MSEQRHHEREVAHQVIHDLNHKKNADAVHLMKEFNPREFNHLLKEINHGLHGHNQELSVERQHGKITHINFNHHDIYGDDAIHRRHSEKPASSHSKPEVGADHTHRELPGKSSRPENSYPDKNNISWPGKHSENSHDGPIDRRNAAIAAHEAKQAPNYPDRNNVSWPHGQGEQKHDGPIDRRNAAIAAHEAKQAPNYPDRNNVSWPHGQGEQKHDGPIDHRNAAIAAHEAKQAPNYPDRNNVSWPHGQGEQKHDGPIDRRNAAVAAHEGKQAEFQKEKAASAVNDFAASLNKPHSNDDLKSSAGKLHDAVKGMRPEEVQMALARALEANQLGKRFMAGYSSDGKISLFEKQSGEKLSKRIDIDITDR